MDLGACAWKKGETEGKGGNEWFEKGGGQRIIKGKDMVTLTFSIYS